MDAILLYLIDYGLWGMFVAAFLAGSVLPLASEVVLAALVAAGVAPLELLIVATLGNTLGSITNYGIGRLGKEAWIERFLRVKKEDLERGQRYVQKYGFWTGLLAWVPVIGELLTVALGYLRVNFPLTVLTVFVGKLVRYWFVVAAMQGAQSLF